MDSRRRLGSKCFPTRTENSNVSLMVALRSNRASSNLACGRRERGGKVRLLLLFEEGVENRQGIALGTDLGAAVLAQLEKGPGLLDEHFEPPAVVAGGRGGEEEAALTLVEEGNVDRGG